MNLIEKAISCLRGLFTRETKIEVLFLGKKLILFVKGKPKIPPQEFVDKNVIACGCCGEAMFPGEQIWLAVPKDEADLEKPGVLIVPTDDKGGRALVACLAWYCCPTAGVMCGTLAEGKKIVPFESPMQQAMRTGGPVVVSDVQSYRG